MFKLQLLILVTGLLPKCCYKYTEFKIPKVKRLILKPFQTMSKMHCDQTRTNLLS